MDKKYLLIGDERICKQIAYVMQYSPYEIFQDLRIPDKFHDYQIVVCKFRKRCRIKNKNLNVIYLDDICAELDQIPTYEQQWGNGAIVYPHVPLWRRVLQKIRQHQFFRTILIHQKIKHNWTFRSKFWIDKIPLEKLKPSEFLLKALYSKPTNIQCDHLEKICHLHHDGEICGCAPGWVYPFGNIQSASAAELYNSKFARIIKLSSMNRSYCFCNLDKCMDAYYTKTIDTTLKKMPVDDKPQKLALAYDKSCNLKCPNCRKDFYHADDKALQLLDDLTQKIIASGWLEKVEVLELAGLGEVFYSKHYGMILASDLKRQQINIFTNGTLFNQKKWESIRGKYQTINVELSVDAATPETYQKMRGGDFKQLVKNLEMLGKLRAHNEIAYLQFNYVVQRDNYHEMIDFIQFARQYHVDKILFTHLNDWGTYAPKEFAMRCLIVKNKYLDADFYEYLKNPIFKDPDVDLWAWHQYLVNSQKRYDKKRHQC